MDLKIQYLVRLILIITFGTLFYSGCSDESNPVEPEKTTGTLKTVIMNADDSRDNGVQTLISASEDLLGIFEIP